MMKHLPERTPGTPLAFLLLVGSAVLWSTSGVLIKWVDWNPLAIAGMRSGIASAVLLVLIGKPKFTWSFAQLGGAIACSATMILFVAAIKLTTAVNAILLSYTAPIFTALFSGWYLNERTFWYDWLATAVVVGGIALFFLDRLEVRGLLGNVMAVGSGLTWTWLTLFLRKQKSESPIESILLGHWLTCIIGIPFMLRGGPTFHGWLGLILLGVFQQGFSQFMYAFALKKMRALDSMLILSIEPVLNPILVFVFIGEIPGRMALLGGGIVFGAVTIRSVRRTLGEKVDLKDRA
jgi:drug/metabolite transporter (DMT)-like permease